MFDSLGYEGRHRTPLNAFPARDANRFLERFVTKGADPKVITSIRHINSINPHNFVAGPHAYATLDALVGIEIKKRITGVNREILGYMLQAIEPILVKTDAVDQCLEAA
jgi:hypothetical protein